MYTVVHIKNGRCVPLREFKEFHEAVNYRNSKIDDHGGNKENDYFSISENSYKNLVSFYEKKTDHFRSM